MIDFTIKLGRDPANVGTIVTVEALFMDSMKLQDTDKRTLISLLQNAVTDAIEKWKKEIA